MLRSLVLVFSFLVLGFAAQAQEEDKDKKSGETKLNASEKSSTEKLVEDPKKSSNPTLANLTGGASGWRFQGALTHVPKLRNDQEDTTDVLGRVDYTINSKHRVRVQQFFTKFYGKYHSEYEFKPTDTTLSHFYKPTLKPMGTNLLWQTSVALPISHESARDDLVTRFSGSLIASKSFFQNKLIAFAVPYARYHWYEFKTSVSGRLMPRYTVGVNLGGLYFVTPELSFYGGVNYNRETVRNSQFDQSPNQVIDGIYRFDLDVTYQVTKHLSGSLSYFQGANYMQQGRYEMVFYDDQASRVALGLNYIY